MAKSALRVKHKDDNYEAPVVSGLWHYERNKEIIPTDIFPAIKILASMYLHQSRAFIVVRRRNPIAGHYRPVSYPDGPITSRYRFIKDAYWDVSFIFCSFP